MPVGSSDTERFGPAQRGLVSHLQPEQSHGARARRPLVDAAAVGHP